jgi:hypothetical protein
MGKPMAIVGGILVLAGVFLGLFIKEMGFWNYNILVIIPIEGWLNAFGGGGGDLYSETAYFAEEVIDMVPGILVAVGGLFLIFQKKASGIIGFVLILAGTGLFFYNMLQNTYFMDYVELVDGNIFWWSDSNILGDFYMRMGYGMIICLAGGIVGLLGSMGSKD